LRALGAPIRLSIRVGSHALTLIRNVALRRTDRTCYGRRTIETLRSVSLQRSPPMHYLKQVLIAAGALAAAAVLVVSAATAQNGPAAEKAGRSPKAAASYSPPPLKASVVSPGPGDSAGVGGTFSVDLSLQARSLRANNLLAGYTSAFNDPNAPSFRPGPNAAAPGLVVLLSTTPTIAGSPLQGPNTNLAGVFQINDISQVRGLKHTFNSWLVTVPRLLGQAQHAALTAPAVNGTAPALLTGDEKPISNVVRETFTIAA